jgi:SAM-dependent methyltransferase
MEIDAYRLMASHEAEHWWFVGRRAVIASLLDRIELRSDARVLEAGCGTGGNLYLLQGRGDVSAFDPHPAALDVARTRYPALNVRDGALPHDLPFAPKTFDLVAALDVLEHIDDDRAALEALIGLAVPGGHVVVTVPTHPRLFGSHDRRLHHRRRYGIEEFRSMCRASGADVVYEGAFNTFLAPIAAILRLLENGAGLDLGNQERLPAAPLNDLLAGLFTLEAKLLRRVRMPAGLSHAAILRRPA